MAETKRILAIGANAKEVAQQLLNGEDVVIDTTDLHPNKKQTGYDTIISYHALQRVKQHKVIAELTDLRMRMKKGGDMYVFVPSLEWAAKQIVREDLSPALGYHLFGEDNRCAFTLMDLRKVCQEAGLQITFAKVGEYTINEDVCEMNFVRATCENQ